MPSSCARRSTLSRSGPSPTRQSVASTPRARSSRNASSTSSTRLIAVMRPIQPTTKRSGGTPNSAAQLARDPRRCPSTRASSAIPRRMTLNCSARRDAERDEVVAHLRADGDEARRRAREPPLDRRGSAAVASRAEVAAQDVAVEGVDDDRRPRVAGERARRPGRARRPSRCACAGCAAAARRISRTSRTSPTACRRAARSRGASCGIG